MIYDITRLGPASYKDLQALIATDQTGQLQLAATLGKLEGINISRNYTHRDPLEYVNLGPHRGAVPFGESKYDLNLQSAALYENLNDVRAARQSGIAKFGAGLGKMLTTAGSTFISSTLGTIYGLGLGMYEAAKADEDAGKAFLSGFINNDISRGMLEFQKSTENVLTNYYSDWEQQAPWYLKMGTANFWADGIIKNMGFTIGAAAAGMTWGGLGAAMNLPKIPGIAGVITKGALGSIGEATIESINMMDDAENTVNMNLDYWELGEVQKAENDYYNNLLLGMNATEAFNNYQLKIDGIAIQKEELKKNPEVQESIKAAGNAVFGWNLGLLTLTNSFELSALFKGGKNLSELVAQKQIQAFAKKLGRQPTKEEIAGIFKEKGLEYTGELLKNPTGAFAGRTLATGFSEGFIEEGGQNLASNTEQVYAASKWNHTPLAQYMDLSSTEEVKSRTDAFSKALEDLYGSAGAPGWQEVAMGFIGGIVGTPFIGKKANGKLGFTWIGGAKNAYDETIGQDKQAKELLNKLNSAISDDKFIETFYTAVGMALSDKEYAKALAEGDTEALKQEEFRAIAELVILFEKLGKIDDLKAIYEGIANQPLSDEDIETLKKVTTPEGGTSPLSTMTKEEISDLYKEKAKTALEKIDIYRKAIENANDFISDEKVLKQLEDYEPALLQLFASRIAFLDANKQELLRRLNKIDAEINSLQGDNLTKEQQDLLVQLQKDRSDIQKQYDSWKDFSYYKQNPEEFKKEFNNWIERVNKVTIGREASLAVRNLSQAETVSDIVDAFKYLDPKIKDSVVKEARKIAPNHVKALIDSYLDFEEDYNKLASGLEELAGMLFPESKGKRTVLNQVLDFARMLTLNDDSPALTRESLKDKINKAVEQLKAIPENQGATELLDLVAPILTNAVDELDKVAPKPSTPEAPSNQGGVVVTTESDELTDLEKNDAVKQADIDRIVKAGTVNLTVEAVLNSFGQQIKVPDFLQKGLNVLRDIITSNPGISEKKLLRLLVSDFEKRRMSSKIAVPAAQYLILYYNNNPEVQAKPAQTISTPESVYGKEGAPANSMSGDAFNTLTVSKDGVAIEFDNLYIKELDIDIQSIRDKYLRFIADETTLYFIKPLGNDKLSKMVLLGVKVDDAFRSKFSKDDPLLRKGVQTINGEDYLIVGTYGYQRTQNEATNAKYAAAVTFINNLFEQQNLKVEDGFALLNDVTTKLYLKEWGSIVTATQKNKHSEPIPNTNQAVFNLLNSQELNPNGIILSNIKFLVWNDSIGSSWVSDGVDTSLINFDLDDWGIPKNIESGNVFILVPTVNGRLTPVKISPVAYQEVKTLLENNELFQREYNDILKQLTDPELVNKSLEEKDALINQALIRLRDLFLFKSSDYLFYDKNTDNFTIKDPITGNILATISLGTITEETRDLIISLIKDIVERANPLINIEHQRLMKTPEFYIGTSEESSLIFTNARKLATEGNKFRVYTVGPDKQLVTPEATPNTGTPKTKPLRKTIESKVLNGTIYSRVEGNKWFKGETEVTGSELEELTALLDAIKNGKEYKVNNSLILKYGDTLYRISNKAYYKLDPKQQLYYDASVEIAKLEAAAKPKVEVTQEQLSAFDLLVLKVPNHTNYIVSTSLLAKSLPTRIQAQTKVTPRNGLWQFLKVQADDALTALVAFDPNSIQDESLRKIFDERSKNGLISLLEDIAAKMTGINLDTHFSLEELLNLLENYLHCH